jgi:hypothetical protein
MADWVDAVRVLHIIFGALWFGGGLFAISIILPGVNAAGPAGKSFMAAILRGGGFGKFFGPVSGLTVLTGLLLYYGRGYHDGPFDDAAAAMVTVGAILAILAFAEGLAVNMPSERKLRAIVKQMGNAPPSPEQASQMEALAMKSRKASMRGMALVALTFLLMVGRVLAL